MSRGLLTTAALDALGSPRLWAIGLAGFLARGGILLFALPVMVLPSIVGLTTFVGPNSVTAAGLAPGFVVLIALTTFTIAAVVILGTLVGTVTERALVDAIVVGDEGDAGRRGLVADTPGLASLVAIRLLALVPVGLIVAVGGVRLGQVGYQELVLPSDSTAPFVIRVLLGAPEVTVALVLAWLLTELMAAVAVRLALIDRRSIPGAVGGALVWIARRPLRSLAVLTATTVGSVVVVGPALVTGTIAWLGVRTVLLGASEPGVALGYVVLFVASWLGALVLAGVAAAWRSAALSLVVMEDLRVGGPPAFGGGTL